MSKHYEPWTPDRPDCPDCPDCPVCPGCAGTGGVWRGVPGASINEPCPSCGEVDEDPTAGFLYEAFWR